MSAVKAAQQVHCIGDIASSMLARSLNQKREMTVPRAALFGNASKLSFGCADRFPVDVPICRHSRPSLVGLM
jgi:hypothetical protein